MEVWSPVTCGVFAAVYCAVVVCCAWMVGRGETWGCGVALSPLTHGLISCPSLWSFPPSIPRLSPSPARSSQYLKSGDMSSACGPGMGVSTATYDLQPGGEVRQSRETLYYIGFIRWGVHTNPLY